MNIVEEACKLLYNSMKGLGTDEDTLIKVIVGYDNYTRQLIKQQYSKMYKKSLEEHIKSETSGDFREAILALLEPINEYEAKIVKKAVDGLLTNSKALIQILCTKEANEIEILKQTYRKLYNLDMETEISCRTSGDLCKLLRSVARHDRPLSGWIDNNLAKSEAKELYDAGEAKFFGTDESMFIKILCSRSFDQLNATFDEYKKISPNDIVEAVKSEMSGNLRFACLTIIKVARSKPKYFAEQLYDALKGFCTYDDDALIRILVSRAEIDLKEIKQCYESMYGKRLYDTIESELSGDFKNLLLILIGNN